MPTTLRKPRVIGPEHHGKRMALDDFDRAVSRDGQMFELGERIIEKTDVPDPRHMAQLLKLRNQLVLFQEAHPDAIYAVSGSLDSKILIASTQSERHPDLSVYFSPPPDVDDVWSLWIPKIVVEIVSPSSARRDYHDKPDEYLELGVSEYWIVDAQKQQMTVMSRWRGQWKTKVLKPTKKYTTPLLTGFTLDLARILAAGK